MYRPDDGAGSCGVPERKRKLGSPMGVSHRRHLESRSRRWMVGCKPSELLLRSGKGSTFGRKCAVTMIRNEGMKEGCWEGREEDELTKTSWPFLSVDGR